MRRIILFLACLTFFESPTFGYPPTVANTFTIHQDQYLFDLIANLADGRILLAKLQSPVTNGIQGPQGIQGIPGSNGGAGAQGSPGLNGTNNAVTVTNFVLLTNFYTVNFTNVTLLTNSTLVLQTNITRLTNSTTVLQTNITLLTNSMLVNFTNTTLLTNSTLVLTTNTVNNTNNFTFNVTNTVLQTNAVTVNSTNAVTTWQTNAVTVNSTNAVITYQTNAVTINSTNAITTQQTNFTTVNFTNTTLQTNVVNGGVATSGWPTQWAWVSVTNQPTLGTASASNSTAFVLNAAAGIKAAGGDTNVPGAYDLAGVGATAALNATNTTSLVRSNSTLFVLNPGNLFSGIVTNRVGFTNRLYYSGGVITNRTVP